jgi:hypothetical protein
MLLGFSFGIAPTIDVQPAGSLTKSYLPCGASIFVRERPTIATMLARRDRRSHSVASWRSSCASRSVRDAATLQQRRARSRWDELQCCVLPWASTPLPNCWYGARAPDEDDAVLFPDSADLPLLGERTAQLPRTNRSPIHAECISRLARRKGCRYSATRMTPRPPWWRSIGTSDLDFPRGAYPCGDADDHLVQRPQSASAEPLKDSVEGDGRRNLASANCCSRRGVRRLKCRGQHNRPPSVRGDVH